MPRPWLATALGVALAAACWLVAPLVDMAVRGTLDQRKHHALRAETARLRVP